MRLLSSTFAALGLAVFAGSSSAHEFWIEPLAYQLQPGGEIKAELKVGQEFSGSSYPYRPSQFERFDMVQGDTVTQVVARIGDTPALNTTTDANGLLVVVHETADNRLTYTEFAKFEKFVAHKAFPDAIAQHDARGLSREKFVESYRRYAKALIGVGDGAGSDTAVGLKTEIVALANPYTDGISEMPVRVLLDGAPRVGTQVELFDKAPNGDVTVTLYQTDENGEATFPVTQGHAYLVDAVWAEALPNNDTEKGAVWKTHWAALTFMVPQ
ncbi:DUF4198 domain-containing protein [uncultured Litoreibacter sp.]|uniref:DUF4198 domain-containing protein n=1 Tax=uncultured Litoreibacter sp. TaxID=1392394 RepID=UPI002627E5E0|nr:DUF4198 domain-containing protein [uncultured Litoreibacter sp.]